MTRRLYRCFRLVAQILFGVLAVIGSHHALAAGPLGQAGVTTVTAQTDVDATIDALIAVAPASQPSANAAGTAAIGVTSNSSYGVDVYDVLMPQTGASYGRVQVLLGFVTL
jgi:hypothetical protein